MQNDSFKEKTFKYAFVVPRDLCRQRHNILCTWRYVVGLLDIKDTFLGTMNDIDIGLCRECLSINNGVWYDYE